MTDAIQTQIKEIQESIATLEAQRGILPDATIDTAVDSLKKNLAELEKQQVPAEPEQQRKLATILMMDIAGHTSIVRDLDPEENMAIIDASLVRLEKPIQKFGGRVTRFTGDGFKAIFGHPEAHDNDPEMAIRAALSLLEEAHEINHELERSRGIAGFDIRIGLDSGRVIIGGESEGEDTIKGMPVNLAARLEQAASPGNVLISNRTERLVHGIFDLESLPPIELKGFDQPVQVFQVTGILAQSFRDPTRGVEGVETPLVGREEDAKKLSGGLENIQTQNKPHLFTLIADAGIGKSRLLHEFEKSIPGDLKLYKGRSLRERQETPYAVFRNLFSRYLEIQENTPTERMRAIFDTRFAAEFGDTEEDRRKTHFIAQLLGFDFSDSPYLEGVLEDAQQLSDRAKIYLADYFKKAAANQVCAIFLEDIHWADDQSLDLLESLLTQLEDRPFLMICNARPSLLERRNLWGMVGGYATNLKLAPLSRRDSRALIGEILKRADNIPLVLQEFIVSGAEGNPLYIEELIKMLIENGVILKTEDRWKIDQTRLLELEVPPTLTGILQARLDRLSPQEKMILQQASVVGRTFWEDVLFQMNASTTGNTNGRAEIQSVLDALHQKEMVFPNKKGAFAGTREFTFKQTILREVTYESVLKRMRPIYHGLVADWLIKNGDEEAGEFTPVIARHLELAGQNSQAVRFLRKAGEQSLKQYANDEAIQYLSRALDLIPESDKLEKFRILRARIEIFSLRGEREDQRKDLAALSRLAEDLDEDARRGESALLQAIYASEHSEYAKIIHYAKKAIDYGKSSQNPNLQGHGNQLWARALIARGEYPEAKTRLEDALRIAKAARLSQIEADSLRFLGMVEQQLSSVDIAIDLFEKAKEIYQRIGDLRGEGRVLNNLGNLMMKHRSYEEGMNYLNRFHEISISIGDRWGEGIVLRQMAEVSRQAGDFSSARALLDQVRAISSQTGNETIEIGSLMELGLIAVENAEYFEAGAHFSSVLDLAQGLGNRPMEAKALLEIGRLFHRQGDFMRAMTYYQQSRQLFQSLKRRRNESKVLGYIALLNYHLDNLVEAQVTAEGALEMIKDHNYPREEAFIRTQMGRVLSSQGKTEQALEILQRGYDLLIELNDHKLAMEPLAGQADILLRNNRPDEAMLLVDQILDSITDAKTAQAGDASSSMSLAPGLEGTTNPLPILLTCYQVLHKNNDPRQEALHKDLEEMLKKQLENIHEVDLQQAFLNSTSTKQVINELFLELAQTEG